MTAAVGAILTAAQWNSNVRDGINFVVNPPVCEAYQNTGQSIPNNVATAVLLDTAVVDSYAGHSTVTNTSRYTAQVAGWYDVLGSVTFAINTTGRRLVVLRVNGVVSSAGQQSETPPNTAGTLVTLTQEHFVFLNAGDYVEVFAFQASGSAMVLPGGSTSGAFMKVQWVHA
jgi:hypothetical protein